jgi:hypothetical protein
MQLVHDLTELVRDNLTEGVTMFLERERYLNEYRKPPIPKKMMLDSQYGVCFRACMAHLVAIVMADGKRHKINAVIEDGHPNVGDTIRIFSDMKRQVKQRLGIDLFGTISKAKKWQSPPLMVCDFLSYSYLKMRASKAKGDMDYAAEASMDPRKKEAGLTFLELLPDALRGLKDKFEKDRQEAAEAWRARRAAMKRHSCIGHAWRGLINGAPSHHSITSSAVGRSVAGIGSLSSLPCAVTRLDRILCHG